MKLAEALIMRADAQNRIEQLRMRLNSNAQVQEGNAPAENPQHLLAEFERTAAELTHLIQRINGTNAVTVLADNQTLADALALRDVLKLRQGVYRGLAQAALVSVNRYSRSEIRSQSSVDVAEIQTLADNLAREHRELDAQIQAANWLTELIE
ncbi:MAG: DIP1984 family protein [Caldilineaceae bacterium]|nr:DIP1984 family protein [Caldilineaceae bacterium]